MAHKLFSSSWRLKAKKELQNLDLVSNNFLMMEIDFLYRNEINEGIWQYQFTPKNLFAQVRIRLAF